MKAIRIKTILWLIAFSMLSLPLTAASVSVKDSLLHELSLQKTPQDSIRILYHLTDVIKGRESQLVYLGQLRSTAHRLGDVMVELDALRQMANINTRKADKLKEYLKWAQALPVSNDQKETVTFIEIDLISLTSRFASEVQLAEIVQRLIEEYKEGESGDIYDKVKRLYEVCIYLSRSTTGKLYLEYLDKLGKLIKQLPPDGRKALPTMYYTQVSIICTRREQYAKAIEADKESLKIIRNLETTYHRQGRVFKDNSLYYYICYRRILSNYPALTPEEVEYYYGEVLKLFKRNSAVEEDFNQYKHVPIYYHMARKEYAEALALLKKTVEAVGKQDRRAYGKYIKCMIEAAKEVGDKAALYQATNVYNDILTKRRQADLDEKYIEMQILYDVNQLKVENAQLELEKREAEITSSRRVICVTSVAIVLLLALLVVLLWMYNNTRRLVRRLQMAKKILQKEQKNLLEVQAELTVARDQAQSANRMKTEFIQNMSHEIRTPLNSIVGFSQIIAECIDNADKEELYEYAKTISDNSKLLLTLVGDVLDISVMESGDVKPDLMLYSVDSVCKLAFRNVQDRVQPGVDLLFEQDEHTPHNLMLLTDPVRLEQLLTNYLTNAAKFTSQGKIVLSYSLDADQRYVTFSVTDTGIGIPANKAELIFERFEKLNSFVQGNGLGLHLCRLIARMLKGEVMVDSTYTQGARFLFIHPYNT